MGRIQGLTELYLTGDKLVKTGEGYVFSITISFTGVSAGQQITLRDGLDGTASPLAPFIAPTAHGTLTKEWSNGKYFATGLFIDFQGSGSWHAELTYR